MEQMLAHLIGDYVLQNHWMANVKTKRSLAGWMAVLIHVLLYGLPFLLLVDHPGQWAVIVGAHLVIDHWRLAQYWVDFWGTGKAGWLPTRIERLLNRWPATMQTTDETGAVSVGGIVSSTDGTRKMLVGAILDEETVVFSSLPVPAPAWLGVWLLILVDNTMHLCVNYAALRWM